MDIGMENDVEYYEFLNYVHQIYKKLELIQKDSISIIISNFDLYVVKKTLDLEIEKLDQLLK